MKPLSAEARLSPAALSHAAPASVPWHAMGPADAAARLGVDPARGLASSEAQRRRAALGSDSLAVSKREPWWEEALEALTEPLVLLLIAVAAVYALLGEREDAVTILAVILLVAGVEAATEARAKRAIGSLRALSAPLAIVVREGRLVEISTADLVPGDVVLLEPGRRVAADTRLLESAALRVDESSLTGESTPVHKDAARSLAVGAELADRATMAFAGTLAVAGRGRGVVVATGRATELGRIAALAESAREPRTPLQLHMQQLAATLLWVALAFSVLIPTLGVLLAGEPLQEMLLTGLTLAFATIPEELPILITIVLGLGAYRLARQRAIVKRLRAAETLGSVSVVGTDKTGTLTENRLRAVVLADGAGEWAPGGQLEAGPWRRLLEAAALANDAQVQCEDGRCSYVGDPTETALLESAQTAGIDVNALRASVQVLDERPFDDQRRRMSTLLERDGRRWLAAKGSPESVLTCSSRALDGGREVPLDDARRERLLSVAADLARRGLRVLAVADRLLEYGQGPAPHELEDELVLLGLVGLEDPPRPEVPAAIRALRAAGVRVVMLTGDHPETARAIAERVGIEARDAVRGRDLDDLDDAALGALAARTSLFARITPEHKLRLVRALQARGEVVAVTGDGVNDGPALREAAIGVAMGQGGTDVAREAADLVLADDNFATVAVAVRAGRVLFENLRKAVRYYLAAKVALIGSTLVAAVAHQPVPFAPVQIIVLELFMDLGASITFTAEPPEEDVMGRPPRDPRRPFLDGPMRLAILAGGLTLAAAVLVGYLSALAVGATVPQAQTVAFVSWMAGHLVLAAQMRAERQPLVRTSLLANRPFLVWIAAALAVLALSQGWAAFAERLHAAPLPPSFWALAIVPAVALPWWWEAWKWERWRQTGGQSRWPSATPDSRV